MNESPIENIDFYFDKTGLMVMTENYHRARGYCCSNGCHHCPFDYESVPEPRKSQLRSYRKRIQADFPSPSSQQTDLP